MVSILPSARSSFDIIGDQIGQNLNQNLPGAIEKAQNRQMLQESLGKIKDLSQTKGAKPLDMLLGLLQAGAGIPGSERYIGQVAPILMKMAEANAGQNVRYPGEEFNVSQRPEGPGFLGQQSRQPFSEKSQTSQFFPQNVGPQGGPGNVPQEATSGQKYPLLNPGQIVGAGKQLAKQSTDAGNPMTVAEGVNIVKIQEDQKKTHNDIVDKELEQRVEGQKTYGKRAVDYLTKALPEDFKASPEVESIFQKIGEEESTKGKSEAEINRYLAKKADQYSGAITNVKKDLSSPRLLKNISRAAEGTYKNFEQAASDVRKHLEPILELGLYDTARNLLEGQGYAPEEREIIINPLSTQATSIMNRLPKMESTRIPAAPGLQVNIPPKINMDALKGTIMELKAKNPNFSLLLARKMAEDKGYDWRSFKDALNELETNGNIALDDDQTKQRGYLDTPPLNNLEKILQSLNLVGR